MKLPALLVTIIALSGCRPALRPPALPTAEAQLDIEIQAMDDSMTLRFNAHDAESLMSLFASDVEFYHDTQGVQDYHAVSAGFHGLFASGSDIRRERLKPLDVYPVPGYGALEVGRHRFCHTENDRRDCGTFEFVQAWRRTSNGWKIARVMSFGH